MISGSLDNKLKMWDFTTINSQLRPFKDFKPADGYPINKLSYSPSGNLFLCCTGSVQAKIFTSDGARRQTTVRGDMYIRDMNNTQGHVAEVLSGQWHPGNEQNFATCSADSTIRLWDVKSKPVGID